MEDSRRQWENISVLVWSINQQVPTDWIAREFKDRGKPQYGSKSFALVEDYHLIRFQLEEDYKQS